MRHPCTILGGCISEVPLYYVIVAFKRGTPVACTPHQLWTAGAPLDPLDVVLVQHVLTYRFRASVFRRHRERERERERERKRRERQSEEVRGSQRERKGGRERDLDLAGARAREGEKTFISAYTAAIS